MHEIVNAIFYVLRGGIAWRLLPSDFPRQPAVYRGFAAFATARCSRRSTTRWSWSIASVLTATPARQRPTSTAKRRDDRIRRASRYDAGKKINGRKRHALVDTGGRALLVEPHPASVQDRDGGGPLLQVSRQLFPFIERVWTDADKS